VAEQRVNGYRRLRHVVIVREAPLAPQGFPRKVSRRLCWGPTIETSVSPREWG
jgi:hypothetical protein